MAIAFKDDYVQMDEKFDGKTYLMSANTLMTWPTDIDASRLYMNTAETIQSLTLLNPDVPRISTGWENVLGKLNKDRSYKRLDGTWEVKDIIRKFKDGVIYTIVLYNPEKDLYDMIEKPIAENLNEKFGFVFNTKKMDSLEVGDTITDEVIYKSTAYDDHMNYRYGKNAMVYYSTSTDTLEDAVLIREGWAKSVQSVEIDKVTVPINTNHVLLNLYGGDKEYKPCPNFGEMIKNSTVIGVRPINNNHILIDFKNSNLNRVYNTDSDYMVSESDYSFIYDLDIFYNNPDPFPNTVFFKQLKGWYDEICVYVDRVVEWATRIKESGSNYTENITFFKGKYQHYNDPEWGFCGKEKNKPFGNMIVEFKVQSVLGLVPGSKVAGRYGDKGVISKVVAESELPNMVRDSMDSILDMLGREINDEERMKLASQIEIVPDEKMPYSDKGPIDILLNASGAIRRLNPGQLVELDLNFCSEAIRERVCELETMEEKENLIFQYLGLINESECNFFYDMYQSFSTRVTVDNYHIAMVNQSEKERFIHNVEEHGFYIRKEHDSPIRYETIRKIYDTFDFIKPIPLYIDIFGTKKRRIIKDGIVAEKYMMVLKHNNNKNFSARSTFRIDRTNLPVKDTTKRDNRSQYSKSPVRIGEAYNLMAAISGALLAEHNIFMRSSILGRKDLRQILDTDGNPLEIKRLKVKDNYININADILNAKIKGIGIRAKFVKENEYADVMLEDVAMPLQIGDYIIYDSPLNKGLYVDLFTKYLKFMEEISFMESYPGEKVEFMWNKVFELPEVKRMNLSDDVKEMVITSAKNKGVNMF